MVCLYMFVYMYCHWRSSYQEGEGWDPINWFNPNTYFVPVLNQDLDF